MVQDGLAALDRMILAELRGGFTPQEIKKKLRLKRIGPVYYALRRFREKMGRKKYDYLNLPTA